MSSQSQSVLASTTHVGCTHDWQPRPLFKTYIIRLDELPYGSALWVGGVSSDWGSCSKSATLDSHSCGSGDKHVTRLVDQTKPKEKNNKNKH